MKNIKLFIFLSLICATSLVQAFDGRLSYSIKYKDMDWVLTHDVKGSRSKITLESNDYIFKEILIHSARNKIYHLDSKKSQYSETPLGSNQMFGDFGKKYNKKHLNESDIKATGKSQNFMGFEAKEFKIKGKGKNTYLLQANELPEVPHFIFSIFSPLREKLPGIKLISDKEPGSPIYIEQKKWFGLSKAFTLELVKVETPDFADNHFELPKRYKLATGTMTPIMQGGGGGGKKGPRKALRR